LCVVNSGIITVREQCKGGGLGKGPVSM